MRINQSINQSQLAVNQMNPVQAAYYHTILNNCWSNGAHRLYFIDGKAGRGKTFLVRAICDTLCSQADIAIVAGSTALSATLYEHGQTAHSVFGIPV
jgi:chromosomal replication initiation ATPase DnaA